MNTQQRNLIGERWIGLAQMYGKEVTKSALTIMLTSIEDLDPAKVLQALDKWAVNSKLARHPFPAELRELINPKVENRDLAIETTQRIRQAVSKFGWPNPDQARAFIGEEGWVAVSRMGGWQWLCQNLGVEIPEHAFIAQTRDALNSRLNLESAGIDTSKPAIEQAKNSGSFADLIKGIGIKTIGGKS